MANNTITAISGITAGHWAHPEAPTGCTVVLCPDGAVAAADLRGGAPATRETDLLRPGNLVERVHAVVLSGGSAFGLDTAAGAMRWLEERGHGFPVANGVVPIVPAAAVYDLSIGRPGIRPDAAAGHAACEAASSSPLASGSVGAGAGASVGKALLIERAMKGGTGNAAERTAAGVTVAALVVVNCWGEVVDPDTGDIVAGSRGDEPGSFVPTLDILRERPPLSPFALENSTVGVVATDAALNREQAQRLAVIAHTGLARTIRPVHTPLDGDIIFALATGTNDTLTDVLQLGALAARAIERAIVDAVLAAESLPGLPSATEWRRFA
jgi:L-aminopeptidase/D-esterase-like protein